MEDVNACFDLASALIVNHRQTSSGVITVVPIVVDDFSKALPVLQTLAEISGALFVDAPELTGPVPRSANVLRSAAWKDGLDVTGSGSTRRIVLTDSAPGLVDAEFEPPSAAASPGDQSMLGIARAATHGHLDEYELAVVVYRETVLDLNARRAAWKALVERFADLPHPTLRTLIVAVESSIDVGLHCRPVLGLRYAVQGSRLVQRHGASSLRASAQMIAHRTDPFVVFVGAGFSASSRLPLGNQLRDSAIRRLLGFEDGEPLTSRELAEKFHDWVKDHPTWMSNSERNLSATEYADRLTLEQVVRAEVKQSGNSSSATLNEFKEHHDDVVSSPGPAVRDLVDLLALQSNQIVLAGVNFDRLIEENARCPIRVFASDDEFAAAATYIESYLAGHEEAVPFLKLHGSIDRPDTCVVSAEQTERGIGADKVAAIRSLITAPEQQPRPWLYVGASMRDLDLLPVLADESFARGFHELWVAPFPVDTVVSFAESREPLWNRETSVMDRMVTETADAFFDALLSAWPS